MSEMDERKALLRLLADGAQVALTFGGTELRVQGYARRALVGSEPRPIGGERLGIVLTEELKFGPLLSVASADGYRVICKNGLTFDQPTVDADGQPMTFDFQPGWSLAIPAGGIALEAK